MSYSIEIECMIDELKNFSIEHLHGFFLYINCNLICVIKTTYIDRYVRFNIIYTVNQIEEESDEMQRMREPEFITEFLANFICDLDNPIDDVRNDPETQNTRVENVEYLYPTPVDESS